jgi:hypothetical protein
MKLSDVRSVYVGRMGQHVLLRFVQRGRQFDLTFDTNEAESLAAKVLEQIREIRPPPPTTPSLLSGAKSPPRLKLVK